MNEKPQKLVGKIANLGELSIAPLSRFRWWRIVEFPHTGIIFLKVTPVNEVRVQFAVKITQMVSAFAENLVNDEGSFPSGRPLASVMALFA